MQTQATVQRGRRQSASKVYLRPAANRDNLHTITNAYVTKVSYHIDRMNMHCKHYTFRYDL